MLACIVPDIQKKQVATVVVIDREGHVPFIGERTPASRSAERWDGSPEVGRS